MCFADGTGCIGKTTTKHVVTNTFLQHSLSYQFQEQTLLQGQMDLKAGRISFHRWINVEKKRPLSMFLEVENCFMVKSQVVVLMKPIIMAQWPFQHSNLLFLVPELICFFQCLNFSSLSLHVFSCFFFQVFTSWSFRSMSLQNIHWFGKFLWISLDGIYCNLGQSDVHDANR